MFKSLLKYVGIVGRSPICRSIQRFTGATGKAYAYAKICQKTGMTVPDIDLWKNVYQTGAKAVEMQISVFLHNNLPARYAKFI